MHFLFHPLPGCEVRIAGECKEEILTWAVSPRGGSFIGTGFRGVSDCSAIRFLRVPRSRLPMLLHRLCTVQTPLGAGGAANPMIVLEHRRSQKQGVKDPKLSHSRAQRFEIPQTSSGALVGASSFSQNSDISASWRIECSMSDVQIGRQCSMLRVPELRLEAGRAPSRARFLP